MNFLYPSFLWAFGALLIPILIHLFNFRRVKRIFFSNVQLLKAVKTETNTFRRLKHLLILLSRLGFLFFLVMAFAQPYFPSRNQKEIQGPGKIVSIYLDNSYSMQSESGNEKYLSLASKQISELAKTFPKDSRFQLITNLFENKEQYPIPAGKLEDRLTETQFSGTYRNLNNVYKRQSNLMERYAPGVKNQVFVFSDFQKSTTGDLNQIKWDTLHRYYLVPIKAEKVSNVMIDSVWLENPFIKTLETNQINVRLKSFSDEDHPNLILKLFIDEAQVSTTTTALKSKGTAMANFNFTVKGQGYKACRITFEDFPVVFDNDYYFVVNASPSVSILHLFENKTHNYIESVFSNESVFKIQNYNINNLDYSLIKTSELVVLNAVSNIEGELETTLRQFVENGGSLVLIPSAKTGGSLATFCKSLGIGGLKNQKTDTLGKGKSNELALIRQENPFFKGMFEKIASNMYMPYANAVIRWDNTGNNLLQFKNQQPYLSEFTFQKGKIYLFGSPLDENYTGFAKHAMFVPVMYKMASASKSFDERLAYTFQEKSGRLKVSNPAKNQIYKLKKDKLEIVPAQRLAGDQLIFELPDQPLEAGFYKLMLNNKEEAILAYNYDKMESDMNFYSPEEIRNTFSSNKNVQVFDLLKNKNFVEEFKEKNIRINLWKYMLIIALCFALAEILLIRFL